MISEKDKRILTVIGAVSGVLILLWLVQNVYTSATGKLVTEFALNYTQVESVHVEGFAVRDEGAFKKGKKLFAKIVKRSPFHSELSFQIFFHIYIIPKI